MRLAFIQMLAFKTSWKRLKLTDEDLSALESAIMDDPTRFPVMRGTGGLRKIRMAAESSSGGKSGGSRVCYAYFAPFALVYLCAVFSKNDRTNLSPGERNDYRKILAALEHYLRNHSHEGRTP